MNAVLFSLCLSQRCVDRLRNSRSRLLEKFRQTGGSQQRCGPGSSTIVQEVMEEEWTALQSEDQRLPSLWGPLGMAEVSQDLDLECRNMQLSDPGDLNECVYIVFQNRCSAS